MSLNDIYRVTVHYELPTSLASWSVYYKEVIDASGGDLDPQILAEAFDTAMAAFILAMLSNDCSQPSIEVHKVFGIKEAKHIVNHGTQVGGEVGPSLPNRCNLVVQLGQATFDQKSNGRIRIPGIPEPETGAGQISTLYRTGVFEDFTTGLITQIAELSAGTGRYDLGVISAKVLNAAPPAKDWAGAFAPVTSIVGNTIIGIMIKRGTKVTGRAI